MDDNVSEASTLVPASNAADSSTHKREASKSLSQEPLDKKLKVENGKVAPPPPLGTSVIASVTDEESASPVATEASPAMTTDSAIQPTVSVEQLEEKSGGRRPRRLAASVAVCASAETAAQPKKSRKKTKAEDTEEEFNTAWICCECNEAECMMVSDAHELIICEGSCRRLFHYPCAGLAKSPTETETFVCQDCQQGRHTCAFCQNYGNDGEDVFPCSSNKCGLFFHESCLEMNGVNVQLIKSASTMSTVKEEEEESDDEEIDSKHFRREFLCPAHHCWTCTQVDLRDQEKKEAAEARKSGNKKGRKKGRSTGGALFGQKTEKTLIVSCGECVMFMTSCALTIQKVTHHLFRCIFCTAMSGVSQFLSHVLYPTHGAF
jgi:hypothetical protein